MNLSVDITDKERTRRIKISETLKGRTPWNKGLTMEDDDRLRGISDATKRNKTGVKWTPEQRANHIRAAQRGAARWNWKGGIESENKKFRKSPEYRNWREQVFLRDGHSCKKCGVTGGTIHPHHIINFSDSVELRLSVDNGITLCKNCHMEFHKKFGQTKNTLEQIVEYTKQK